jgi:hypothetical protein
MDWTYIFAHWKNPVLEIAIRLPQPLRHWILYDILFRDLR